MKKNQKYLITVRVGDPEYMPICGKKIKFEKSEKSGKNFILASCEGEVIGLAESINPEVDQIVLPDCFFGTAVKNSKELVVKSNLESRDSCE